MDELKVELQKLEATIAWTNDILRIAFVGTECDRAANGCLDLAIEHGAGICILATHEHYGPMFALIRVIYESVVRGLWLVYCPEDFVKFESGEMSSRHQTGFKDLIRKIEARINKPGSALMQLAEKHYRFLSDLTHTGYQHISRRHSPDYMGANYPENEIRVVISLTGCFILIAGSTLASRCESPEIAEQFIQRMREYKDIAENQ